MSVALPESPLIDMPSHRLFLFFNWTVVSTCLLMTGCGDAGDQAEAKAPANQQRPATTVGYIEVEPVLISRTEQLPGRVVAYKVAEIRPQVSGIVEARLFEEGSYVDEGQKLYQIDPARYEADFELSQASLEDAVARQTNAQLVMNRYVKLIETNAISQQQFDDAVAALSRSNATVAIAKAEVKIARINLDYTSVHSPISGYISPSNVTSGALVTARQERPLATVRQLDPVYVDLSQTAAESRKLQKRLTASKEREAKGSEFPVSLFLSDSSDVYPQKGALDATDLAVDLQTGAIRLRSIFPNPDGDLLPGMFVRASIEDVGQAKEMIVPQKAVQIGADGGMSVWTIDSEDKVRQRTIRTGASYENNWIVLDGLDTADRVVVEGSMGLSEGAPVNPTQINL